MTWASYGMEGLLCWAMLGYVTWASYGMEGLLRWAILGRVWAAYGAVIGTDAAQLSELSLRSK